MITNSPFFCLMANLLALILFLCIDAKNKIDQIKCFYCIIHFKLHFWNQMFPSFNEFNTTKCQLMLEELHEPLKRKRST